MRNIRAFVDGVGIYHVVNQISMREGFLSPEGRTQTVVALRESAAAHGVEILAYAVLPDHVHALVRVNDGERVLPAFMARFAKRCTVEYHYRQGRRGRLWAATYRSLLVANERVALSNLAAYIDLNAVRTHQARKPEDYFWSSFGAFAENALSYRAIYGVASDAEARVAHIAAMAAQEAKRKSRERELREAGRIGKGEHLRFRAFTRGLALGSEQFLTEYFNSHRDLFPPSRKIGPRAIACFSSELRALRDLRW